MRSVQVTKMLILEGHLIAPTPSCSQAHCREARTGRKKARANLTLAPSVLAPSGARRARRRQKAELPQEREISVLNHIGPD